MDLWEHYRWICSVPELSAIDGYVVIHSGSLEIPKYLNTNYQSKDGHPPPEEFHSPSHGRSHMVPWLVAHQPQDNHPLSPSNDSMSCVALEGLTLSSLTGSFDHKHSKNHENEKYCILTNIRCLVAVWYCNNCPRNQFFV